MSGCRTTNALANAPWGKRCVLALAGLMMWQLAACAGVDVVRLTSATFPSKSSSEEVEVLEQEPTRPHVRIAQLHIDDSSSSFKRMQSRVLAKAASLGADAVVFAKPERIVTHQIAYQPVYSPWGYYSPFYGPAWGYGAWYGPWAWGGYAGSMAVPYDLQINALSGTAIRYTGSEKSAFK